MASTTTQARLVFCMIDQHNLFLTTEELAHFRQLDEDHRWDWARDLIRENPQRWNMPITDMEDAIEFQEHDDAEFHSL